MEQVIEHDIFISSPNHRNYVENEIVKLLHGQELFLREVEFFVNCINQLDVLEKTIIYYHYLANELLPILAIKDYYANGVSQTSFYRIRNKAVINLVDNLLKIH